MSFTAKATDNATHHVQVYSDVSGGTCNHFLGSASFLFSFVTEWLSGDRTQKILWSTTSNPDVVLHSVTLQTQAIYTEILDQPEWGTLYFATPGVSLRLSNAFPLSRCMMQSLHATYQSGLDADARANFTHNGVLNLQQDRSRSISNGSTVFALAYDLYNISATQSPPVIWAIGHTTDFVINYTNPYGAPPTPRSPYYKTRYSDDIEMASTCSKSWGENMSDIKAQMIDFLNDFNNASFSAQQLDEKIFQDSQSVAQDLSSLTSLALAEVYGSMQLTVWTDGHGNLDKSDIMMFMKNIGGVNKK